MQNTTSPVTIVLGIPGPWPDHVEFANALSGGGRGFGLCDGQLTHAASGQQFGLEMMEHDPGLRLAFELANRQSLAPADLDRIATHRQTAYLFGPGGSLGAARNLMQAAAAVLDAGGYGVKVETAGVALSAQDWLEQTRRRETHVGALYIAYVALIGRQGQFYSCGMHNLGFPDAIVSAGLAAAQAGALLRGFLMQIIHEQPLLVSGETVVNDESGKQYRITHEPCHTFPPDDPFHNPFGVWRLQPL